MVGLTYQITAGELYGTDNLNVTLETLATSLSNAGDYTITIGASNGNYDITLIDGTYTIALKVLTQGTIVINAADKPYTGESVTWDVEDITLTGATFTVVTYDPEQDYMNVGEYTLSVNATSSANYTFNQDVPAVSGDTISIIVTVQIVQAENAWVVELTVSDITFGSALVLSAQALFQGVGEPIYMYSTTQEGVYSTEIPTNVGTYWIKALVAGTLNYTGLESTALEYDITPYYVDIPQLIGAYTYNKTAQTVEEINDLDSSYYAVSGTLTATNAGNYSVTYTLNDTLNTLWDDMSIIEKTLNWAINRADITLVADEKSGEYGDPVQELTYSVSFGVNYDNEIVPDLSTVVTVESPVGEYQIAITAENENYNITLVNGTYIIGYATYDMSGITFVDGTFTYDSTAKYIYVSGSLPSGVTVEYLNNGKIQANADPGYTVTAEFTGNPNYHQILDMQATLYINKASISFTADDKSSAYGAELTALTATTVGTNYDSIVPILNTTATAISDANIYDIFISVDEAYYLNYNISLTNGIYTITQAENYWVVALACEDIYYGNMPIPSAQAYFQAAGEPVFTYSTELEGVYTSTVPSTVNNYFVKATVLETTNYSGLVSTLEFNIYKATISTAGFSFEDLSVTYNSTAQLIIVTGEIPNGVIVNYINNSLTNVGAIEATAQFTIPDPDNFNAIPDMTATLTVTPAPITLTADDKSTDFGETLAELTFTVTVGTNYNNEIVPMLNTIATSLSDVGSYEITITAMDTNYDITLINGTYSITQAENSWVFTIVANDSIYGSALSITATPAFGTAVFYYSTDPEIDFSTTAPTLVNTYYVFATVEETLNYSALVGATVSFDILKATLSEAVFSYDYGTATWDEVITTVNGLVVSGVTYTVGGIPNPLRSYTATEVSEGFTIISIPEDTDNYAESSSITLPTHSVEFTSAYGVAPATQYIFSGYIAIEPETPVSDTHTFTRWKESVSNNTWAFLFQPVEGNIVIVAEWTPSTFNVYYYDGETNITLDLPALYDDYKAYTYGSGWTFLLSAPYIKTGYTFNYWADNEGTQVLEITDTQYGDIIVYASWMTNQYSITYYSSYDGGAYEYLNIQYYNYGEATSALAIPDALTYFRYEYWFSDTERETTYTFTTMPAANVSLYGAFVWDIGLGDVNGDGTVDTDDITIYRQWLVGGYYAEIILAVPEYDGDIILRVADINDDGVTDIRDVSSIRMSIVGGYSYVIKDFSTGSSVTGEEIATAAQYTATFKDYDGTTLSTYTTEHLRSAVAPADPERVGYTFTGWDMDFSSMTADITVTATYTINQYTATFKNYDEETLGTSTVDYLTSAVAPADPERVGYTFTGWDTDYSSMTGDITVTATYSINQYTATFKDYDGETLGTSTVNYLTSAVAPADPERDGYTFTGWDTDFSSMTADITVTATYEPN
jgi:uncharacterized repeat protein (TIGR02543 family)